MNFGLILVAVVVWLLGQAELASVRFLSVAREFEARAREFAGPEPAPRPLPVDPAAELAARRFSGLAWDADRRVWVQWLNGVPVRDLSLSQLRGSLGYVPQDSFLFSEAYRDNVAFGADKRTTIVSPAVRGLPPTTSPLNGRTSVSSARLSRLWPST